MKKKMWEALLPAVGGCATIVEGTDQTVTIITDPPGAVCELKRDGDVVGVVNPTPGSVPIDKSQHVVTVNCQLDGHEDAIGTLSSEFEGMTFGNILFGGIIGVGVDAASGAMHQYDDSVTIILREAEPAEDAPETEGDDADPADPDASTGENGAPLT